MQKMQNREDNKFLSKFHFSTCILLHKKYALARTTVLARIDYQLLSTDTYQLPLI